MSLSREELSSIEIIGEQMNYDHFESELLSLSEKSTNVHEITEELVHKAEKSDLFDQYKVNKRKNPRASNLKPVRSFQYKWFSKPGIKEWVAPVPNKPSFVSCKFCKIIIRAHFGDLVKHASSQKHRKNTLMQKNISLSVQGDIQHFTNVDEYLQSPVKNTMTPPPLSQEEESTQSDSSYYPASIGFIGCGNMAQALISGFLSNELIDPANIIVSAPSKKNLVKLKALGIKTTHDNNLVVEASDIIFLAVKPHIIPVVLANLDALTDTSRNPLFVSIATGLNLARLEAMLNHIRPNPRVIRIMPNTPCMVLQGCCVFSLGSNVDPTDSKVMKCFLGAVGLCEEIPESQIDAACGVAGSGPAYIYAAIEAMADGAVKMGLPRTLATALAAQTVKGAATMVLETGKHPGQLKDEVCSPGGTTITAMHTLEKNGLRGALISAVEASASKSKELG